jgi:hypothetical protein
MGKAPARTGASRFPPMTVLSWPLARTATCSLAFRGRLSDGPSFRSPPARPSGRGAAELSCHVPVPVPGTRSRNEEHHLQNIFTLNCSRNEGTWNEERDHVPRSRLRLLSGGVGGELAGERKAAVATADDAVVGVVGAESSPDTN